MRKLNLPVSVEVGPEDMPTSVQWRGGMQSVNRVLDRWQFNLAWATNDAGREYFVVELRDRTRLELSRNRNNGTWAIQAVREPWFRRRLSFD